MLFEILDAHPATKAKAGAAYNRIKTEEKIEETVYIRLLINQIAARIK